ncbi:MAG: sigma-54-dependent Fis family transcriptional regulator [Planctomycetes bacterium]|nr:sigma-54-dependent Fis family transcriptional regulator [Planctomycetota bacterium]
MPKLIVKEGYNRGAIFEITSDSVSIGRDVDNSIQVIDDKISRSHAKILREATRYAVIDNRSRNGTSVNGLPIEHRTLNHGDEVRIGDTLFLYMEDAPMAETVGRARGELSAQEPSLAAGGTVLRRLDLIATSKPMHEVLRQVTRSAAGEAPVLVSGEPGTGKELVARSIHLNGTRRDSPFVTVNCSSLSESPLESEIFGHERGAFANAIARKMGALEMAGKGTLFLDEVSELPVPLQQKVFRVLDKGEFQRIGGQEVLDAKCRLIVATRRDLLKAVQAREFRNDLFHLLSANEIRIPALRDRPEDIPPLIDYFFRYFRNRLATRVTALSADALARLRTYHWPANVRELRNTVERALLSAEGDTLALTDLPLEVRFLVGTSADKELLLLRDVEKRCVSRGLKSVGGNRTQAAQILGTDPKTLQAKIDQYGLPTEPDGPDSRQRTPSPPPQVPPTR